VRNEIKIPINREFRLHFDQWKDFDNKIIKPHEDRYINSIYYDDDNFITAQNNLSGISERRKYRIRWYGEDIKNFKYEVKLKKNNFGKKIYLNSEKSFNKLDLFSFKNKYFEKKENQFFLNYINNFNLKPKLKINYLRSYFLYNGKIRITYDKNINYHLANNFKIGKEKIEDFMDVIEFKFKPENIGLAQDLIQKSKFVPKRFSKYLRGLYMFGVANYL
tara:strand:- start:370 stop:1026 length:657 start_codon:yes stop_codon:yes gene_type:complete